MKMEKIITGIRKIIFVYKNKVETKNRDQPTYSFLHAKRKTQCFPAFVWTRMKFFAHAIIKYKIIILSHDFVYALCAKNYTNTY